MSRDPKPEPAAADEVLVQLVAKARGNELLDVVSTDAERAADLVAAGLARYAE